MKKCTIVFLLLLGLSTKGFGQQAQSGAATKLTPTRPLVVPLEVRAPEPPTAFQGGNKTHMVYELHLTNFSKSDCFLSRLEVFAGENHQRRLAQYEGKDLAGRMTQPGSATQADKQRIPGGRRAVVYMWLTLDPAAETPSRLTHRLSVKVGEYPEELSLDAAPVSVLTGPIAIDPPLRGDRWQAANGPSNTSGHRMTMIPLDGLVRIAQRFAIDWVRLREDGRTFTGDPLDNKNYLAYGSQALAVSDGVVVTVKDGIPQNIPGENSRAVPITLETVGGNHVILDIGKGHFAFYAHLQPGSIKVKVGDKIRRGQVLGLVGNSGNSTEPHLHFHIGDANSPLGSEGLPYAIRSFEVQGKASIFGWKPSASDPPAEKRVNQIPIEDEIVRFP